MSTQWLSLQSFQQGQELLEAINLLSIHAKLQRNGVVQQNEERDQAIQHGREKIKAFLQDLAPLVEQAEENQEKPLLGIDLRRRQLVNSFLKAIKNPRQFHSALFRKSISEALRLLESEAEDDQQQLIDCLADLRLLVEEHTNHDTVRILGEI